MNDTCEWCGYPDHRGHFCARPLEHRGRPGYGLRFRYDPKRNQRLMDALPTKDRRWWPEHGCWWVSADHVKVLRRMFRKLDEALIATKHYQEALAYRGLIR